MTEFDDLDDDCLRLVLGLLEPKELFRVLKINKRMNRLATEKLRTRIKEITFSKSDGLFSNCSHLDTISEDEVLDLESLVTKYVRDGLFSFQGPAGIAIFLSPFSKCSGVKSIDLAQCECATDLLLEIVRRCPELECVKLKLSVVDIDGWNQILDQIGHQMVHFAKYYVKEKHLPSEGRLLEMIAEKCSSIELIEWSIGLSLTSDFSAALRMLPETCWVALDCADLGEHPFEDNVDELRVEGFDCSLLGNRIDRLSSLKCRSFNVVDEPSDVVDFGGLEKLTFLPNLGFIFDDFLIHSRFPLLKKFCLYATDGPTEDCYNRLFVRLKTIQTLKIILIFKFPFLSPLLPGSAIHQLKNLKKIKIEIFREEDSIVSISLYFRQKLELYVDEVSSLKKLTVRGVVGIFEFVKEELERIKLKQNRVEVDFGPVD